MTRQHCLRQLLRFGPMSRCELLEVTRWPASAVDKALEHALRLDVVGLVRHKGNQRRSYELTPTSKALLGVPE